MRSPWNAVHQVAEHTASAYDPGEGAAGRCDLQLAQDACYAARLALEGARNTPEGDRDADACEAVGELLRALHRVLTKVSDNIADIATAANNGYIDADELPDALAELADDLVGFRGTKVAPWREFRATGGRSASHQLPADTPDMERNDTAAEVCRLEAQNTLGGGPVARRRHQTDHQRA